MPVITISREIGSGGTYIALKLAEALSCHVYDRELIHEIAQKLGKDHSQLQDFDQETYNRVGIFFQEALSSIAQGGMVFHPFGIGTLDWEAMELFSAYPSELFHEDDYLEVLKQVMKEVAAKPPAVILGRGGSQILKDYQTAFHIRIVANKQDRVKRLMEEQKVEEEKALSIISQKDEAASKFIYDFFDNDWADPHNYHLVINTSLISPDNAIKQILNAV